MLMLRALRQTPAQNWRGPGGFPPSPLTIYQPAYKPGFVWHACVSIRDGHSSGTPVARRLKQPTRMTGPDGPRAFAPLRHSYSVLLPVGFAVPLSLLTKRGGLLPHRFTLTLANTQRGRGGLFSVALSLRPTLLSAKPSPPDVIRHRSSMEPGLSSPAPFRA
jgi:hypothetical protein